MKAKQRKEQTQAFAILAVAAVIAILASVSGCVTRKACESRFGQCGFISPVRVEVHDTTVVTEERVVTDTFRVVKEYLTTDTVSILQRFRTIPRVHTVNNVRLQWLNDSTLVASAVCKSDTVRIKGATKTVTQVKETVREVEKIPIWVWYAFGAVGLFLALIFVARR